MAGSNCAKKEKVRISKMSMEELLVFLLSRYVLYLRGEEMFKFNGYPVDPTVEYLEDGSFKPTEEGIAKTFKFFNNLWERQVKQRYRKEYWDRYLDMFKKSFSEEWNASHKSISIAKESQS
jgi:hypothetical protein